MPAVLYRSDGILDYLLRGVSVECITDLIARIVRATSNIQELAVATRRRLGGILEIRKKPFFDDLDRWAGRGQPGA
jgi:hypothetical protein